MKNFKNLKKGETVMFRRKGEDPFPKRGRVLKVEFLFSSVLIKTAEGIQRVSHSDLWHHRDWTGK